MRRFVGLAVVSILIYCPFLFAQEVKYQEFTEVEIIPNAALSISDIEALPKAPPGSIENLDNGAVLVQIPADDLELLMNKGTQIKPIRSFMLVTPAANQANMMAGTAYEYGENPTDADIPIDGSFTGTGIDFTSSAANIIISVDVHYEIESYSILYAEISDYEPETRTYSLVDGEYEDGLVSETKTGITTFNGMTLNKTWALWAREEYSSGDGYINYWWLKIYYYNSGSDYCSATTSSTAYEYISRVLVGSINNSTGSSGYANYTGLSTSMIIGTGYPITVNNGNPFSTDGCGIWVDWNQDKDFDDAGEAITVSGNPGAGPYTATIIPPASALAGNTRMRVRIVDRSFDSLLPCGTTSYGEVEDYTINVSSGPTSLKVSGNITNFDNFEPLSGVLVEIYNGPMPGTPAGLTDISDANGNYEIQVPAPWTGYVHAEKQGYIFQGQLFFEDVTADQIQDLVAYTVYSGGSGEPNDPYRIATVADWQILMNTTSHWGKNFIVTADIDLQGVALTPIGYDRGYENFMPFWGVFDGNGHIVRHAHINEPDNNSVGLFGAFIEGTIKNLGVEDVNIIGRDQVGGLVGWNGLDSVIENCYVAGSVAGYDSIGGLTGDSSLSNINKCYSECSVRGFSNIGGMAGWNYSANINNCFSTGQVSGNGDIGGLIGSNDGNVSDCFALGAVKGDYFGAGGLIGLTFGGAITDCYAKGAVDGNIQAGGLIGENQSPVVRCYAWGSVSGTSQVGGLIGSNVSSIIDSYAIGSVNANIFVGGLAGYNASSNITNCYSAGAVNGVDYYIGGLLGANENGIISSSFWDVNTSGQTTSDGGEGKTTEQMRMKSTYTGWNFDNIWRMCADGEKYPKLRSEFTTGDFECPDGVDFIDFAELAKQWKLGRLSFDIAPGYGDGIVNYLDWAAFANNWQGDLSSLFEFSSQWLMSGSYNADIAPQPAGDGVVDILDFAAFIENWLQQE